LYHTERSLKAPDQTEYKNLTGKISSNATYSVSLLETCTGKLGLKDTTVLHTPPAKATTDYKNFVVEVAEKYDWVVSLVAMVPCIQVSTPTRTPINHSMDGNQLS
jgi:thiaminase